MEISNLIEMTPELKAELLTAMASAKALADKVGGRNFTINIVPKGHTCVTIFDRYEGDLGFYTHEITEDGVYSLSFVNSSHTPEADMYEKAFYKEFKPELYNALYKEDSNE
jgi:hypothetical protein